MELINFLCTLLALVVFSVIYGYWLSYEGVKRRLRAGLVPRVKADDSLVWEPKREPHP